MSEPVQHEITAEGESTSKWAFHAPGFRGTIKQLLCCARCGEYLPFKRHNEPRHFRDALKPTFHVLCDDCYDALPDDAALAKVSQQQGTEP